MLKHTRRPSHRRKQKQLDTELYQPEADEEANDKDLFESLSLLDADHFSDFGVTLRRLQVAYEKAKRMRVPSRRETIH
jgi:hypothetical protein